MLECAFNLGPIWVQKSNELPHYWRWDPVEVACDITTLRLCPALVFGHAEENTKARNQFFIRTGSFHYHWTNPPDKFDNATFSQSPNAISTFDSPRFVPYRVKTETPKIVSGSGVRIVLAVTVVRVANRKYRDRESNALVRYMTRTFEIHWCCYMAKELKLSAIDCRIVTCVCVYIGNCGAYNLEWHCTPLREI